MKALLWVLTSVVVVALAILACGGNNKPPLTPDGPDMELPEAGGAPAPVPPG